MTDGQAGMEVEFDRFPIANSCKYWIKHGLTNSDIQLMSPVRSFELNLNSLSSSILIIDINARDRALGNFLSFCF